jgi:hypothetical protein
MYIYRNTIQLFYREVNANFKFVNIFSVLEETHSIHLEYVSCKSDIVPPFFIVLFKAHSCYLELQFFNKADSQFPDIMGLQAKKEKKKAQKVRKNKICNAPAD